MIDDIFNLMFNSCRASTQLSELPLSAHLLAPVQRICRYPLHLAELLKTADKRTLHNTASTTQIYHRHEYEQMDVSEMDIPDTRHTIELALDAMKGITEAVNEGKRHSELIARHQANFQNFKGPPLHLHSSRFFLQMDATRQKQNLWNSSCTLFLFDNQLIYCKRDILKRAQFIYKGRIFLDKCRVVNARDGRMFGHNIKNSLRLYCETRDKWYDFSFRSANRKQRFLAILALERQFGSKTLNISEMTGYEYALEEHRDYSDQSDYDCSETETNGVINNCRQHCSNEISGIAQQDTSSVTCNMQNVNDEKPNPPESPVKSSVKVYEAITKKFLVTSGKHTNTAPALPIAIPSANVTNCAGTANGVLVPGSLNRHRLGKWFRRTKSSTVTPNHSPTHLPTGSCSSAHSTGDLQLSGLDNDNNKYINSLLDREPIEDLSL